MNDFCKGTFLAGAVMTIIISLVCKGEYDVILPNFLYTIFAAIGAMLTNKKAT